MIICLYAFKFVIDKKLVIYTNNKIPSTTSMSWGWMSRVMPTSWCGPMSASRSGLPSRLRFRSSSAGTLGVTSPSRSRAWSVSIPSRCWTRSWALLTFWPWMLNNYYFMIFPK